MIRLTPIDLGDATDRAELIEFLIAHEYPFHAVRRPDRETVEGWIEAGRYSGDENRLEGTTREDNIAMRKSFVRSGFVKEAHYREAWPTETGVLMASTAYGILRRDWQTGRTTTFEWNDLTA